MGAHPNYGGIRFFNNEDLTTLLFSIGKGGANTIVESGNFLVSSGNVGIGTPTPTAKLHIAENSGQVRIGSPTTSYGGVGFAGSLTAANAALWGTATTTIIGAAGGGSIEMKLGNDAGGNGSLKMEADKLYYTGGDVGIGASPVNNYRLEVYDGDYTQMMLRAPGS